MMSLFTGLLSIEGGFAEKHFDLLPSSFPPPLPPFISARCPFRPGFGHEKESTPPVSSTSSSLSKHTLFQKRQCFSPLSGVVKPAAWFFLLAISSCSCSRRRKERGKKGESKGGRCRTRGYSMRT